MYKEVVIVGDGSGHEFIIPVELRDRFTELIEGEFDEEFDIEVFEEEFGEYMCGGSTRLYIKVEE